MNLSGFSHVIVVNSSAVLRVQDGSPRRLNPSSCAPVHPRRVGIYKRSLGAGSGSRGAMRSGDSGVGWCGSPQTRLSSAEVNGCGSLRSSSIFSLAAPERHRDQYATTVIRCMHARASTRNDSVSSLPARCPHCRA
jgi:hypothetical protein